MVKCVVSVCPNRVNRGLLNRAPKRFFSLPDDPERLKVWGAALSLQPPHGHLICEDHFLPEDVSGGAVSSRAFPIMHQGPALLQEAEQDPKEQAEQVTHSKDTNDSFTPTPNQRFVNNNNNNNNNHTPPMKALTQRFLALVAAAPGGSLDLRQAQEALHLRRRRRRRLEEVVNVLIGLRLMERTSNHVVRWTGRCPLDLWTNQERQEELEQLERMERQADALIKSCCKQLFIMTDDSQHATLAYVTLSDLCDLGCLQDQTLLVVKAPDETTMKIPPPTQDSIQIHLQADGPVLVLACDITANEKSGHFLSLGESRVTTTTLLQTDSSSSALSGSSC